MKTLKPKSLAIVAIIVFFSFNSFGYKAPIKFGKPNKADLEMTVYEADSTAEAVILCSYGYFNSANYQFTQILRIKILKQSGTHWGSKVFPSMSNKTLIKGKTFNLENGEIVVDKLGKESIFKDRIIGNSYQIKVAMPNVKVGSVIDLMIQSPGLPFKWRFQELIPVRHSELVVEKADYLTFQKNYFGYIPFDFSSKDRWFIKNIPAFKIEPFMDSYKNYISKFEFDLLRITHPDLYQDIASTWQEAGNTLLKSNYFGVIYRSRCRFLKDVAEQLNNENETKSEKIKAAYEFIKEVKWNSNKSKYTSVTSLSTIYKDKLGNVADINFLLINLLNQLDIKAYPVVLSTRDNGFLSPFNPSLNKLNYTVCCADVDGEKIILDATEEKMPMGLIPERIINNRGRLIMEVDKNEWIDLITEKKEIQNILYDLTLNKDNSITGTKTKSYADYGAFNKRKELKKFNSEEEYLIDFESRYPGLTILEYNVKDKEDIYKKLIETYKIKYKKHVEEIDNLVMVNLNLFEQIEENIFKTEERIYPVSYPYNSEKGWTVKFTFPEDYQVSELPKSILLKLPEKGGKFLASYTNMGNTIILRCKLNINKKMFLPEEYKILREFYSQIVKKHAEPVILKKI